jgi:DNA/RNA-binding domain of Phe-tRNA-synthetase-like protein
MASSILLQDDNSLFQSCYNWEQAVRKHLVDKINVKTHKLLQICSQAVDKLCSHCLFPVVVTSLEQAVNNL